MAILIEGISIVVRCKAIIESYQGGQHAFVQNVPNGTLCADGELAAISFMTPADAKEYVGSLEKNGLRHIREGRYIDIVVIDQNSGVLKLRGQNTFLGLPRGLTLATRPSSASMAA